MKSILKKVRLLLFIVVIVFAIFLSVVGVLFVAFLVLGSNEVEQETYTYKHLSTNPIKGTSLAGMITIFEEIDTPFIFNEDEEGNYELISNFGEEEYECVGTCFCEEDRRSVARTAVSKGLLTLVAAVSTTLAYQASKSYFEDKCSEDYSEFCSSPELIRSEVEDCAVFSNIPGYHPDVGFNVLFDPKKMEIHPPERTEDPNSEGSNAYYCKGKCRLSPANGDLELKKNLSFLRGRTAFKEIRRMIQLFKSKGPGCYDMELESTYVMANTELGACERFLFDHLHPFCERKSMVFDFVKKNEEIFQFNLCAGYSVLEKKVKSTDGPMDRNRSIVCRRMVTY